MLRGFHENKISEFFKGFPTKNSGKSFPERARDSRIPSFPLGNRSGLGLPEFCQGIASSLKIVKKVTKFKFYKANSKFLTPG